MSNSERFTDTGMTSVFYNGVNSERERIIKLLQQDICLQWTVTCCDGACSAYQDAIKIIKGEQESARTHENDTNPRFEDAKKLDLRTNARNGENK